MVILAVDLSAGLTRLRRGESLVFAHSRLTVALSLEESVVLQRTPSPLLGGLHQRMHGARRFVACP